MKTYINARYYNIQNSEKPARAFYIRILDELEYKEDILMEKCDEENENLDEKQFKLNLIHKVKEIFGYVLFFDNVRNVENFKNIDSLREITKKIMELISSDYNVKKLNETEERLYKEVKSDMIEKEVFLDKFDTDEFSLVLGSSEFNDNIYYTELEYNVRMPMQYSESAINKVFSEGIIAEDKLQIEYVLLSVVAMRDIINANFSDIYIAEFTSSLFSKKQKLNGILSLIENQALQEKINLNIMYSEYIKNKNSVLEYTKRGFNFVITLDDAIKNIYDVEKLKMFKLVLVPKDVELYKEIKEDNSLKNVILMK